VPHETLIRPLQVGDLPGVAGLLSADQRPALGHLVAQDPGGCWVAESDGEPVGVVAALTRELMWVLSVLEVRRDMRGRGVGRQLLEVAMTHGRGCLRGLIAVSPHPAAVRLTRQSGFTVHPWMRATGSVSRDVLPVTERARDGSAGDSDLMDSVDRQVRGAAHGVDHRWLASTYPLRVIERTTGNGYVYVAPGGGPALLAATNRRTATELLWESLAATDPTVPVTVPRISSANGWALDVVLEAGLEVGTDGYLGVRDVKPPTPYLPHAHLL